MYKLKKGEHIAVTDKEYKKDQFIALGFELVREPKKQSKKTEGKDE